jgi:hypothetical protein
MFPKPSQEKFKIADADGNGKLEGEAQIIWKHTHPSVTRDGNGTWFM